MNEQLQNEEFSLLDLLKVLLSKIKLLILVLLCGCFLGGTVGLLTTYNVNYWGTHMEFYVNPVRPETDDENSVGSGGSTYGVYGAYGRHVMDNIVKLLNSEKFGEILILNGTILPAKDVWVNPNNEREVALNLNDKIDAAQQKVDITKEKQALYLAATEVKSQATEAFTEKLRKLNDLWYKYYKAGDVKTSVFNETEYKNKVLENDPDLKAAYEEMLAAENEETLAKATVKSAKETYNAAKAISDEATKTALTAWRKTARYRNLLHNILESVEFSYVEDEKDLEDAVNLARSFIYVNISVLGDDNKGFAEDLLARVQSELPKYVCEKMIIPDGYSGTSCTEITTLSDIDLTNKGYTTSQSIKFALLFGAAALIVACVIVIIVDRSDKRVRDYDAVARQLNIPLLGVIPSIDDEKMVALKDAKNQNKGA